MKNNKPSLAGRYVLACLIYLGTSFCPAFGQRHLEEAIPYRNAATIRTAEGFTEVNFRRKAYIGKADPARIYYSYYRDSIYATQGGYHGHLLYGRYIERYDHKGLKVVGRYRDGLRTGTWQYWDTAGVLLKVSRWKKGQEQTVQRYHDGAEVDRDERGWFGRMKGRIRKWVGM